MNQLEASKLVGVLMAYYPNARIPDGTIAAYEAYLMPFEHERVRDAIRQAVGACKFLPTIAEIMAAYDSLAPKPEGGYPLFRAPRRKSSDMPPGVLAAEIHKFLKRQERT